MAPEHLYRYRTFSDREERTIVHDEVYFPSPLDFNDPFDCRIRVIPPKKRDLFIEVAKTSIHDNNPKLTESEIKEKIDVLLEFGVDKNHLNLQEILTDSIKKRLESICVYSLSKINDNILMWSHYSDGHKGFCLEFNKFTNHDVEHEVKYKKGMPILKLSEPKKSIEKLLTVKSCHWEYEKEWRIIDVERGPGIYKLPKGLLSGVIFGCQMTEENRKKLILWSNERNDPLKIYEAKPKKDKFGLDIIRISP